MLKYFYAVNIPAFSSLIGLDVDMNRELLFTSIASLFSSISFYPSAFNCSGSVFFYVCGGKSRIHGLISGIFMISIFFTLHYIVPVTPTFVVSLITQYIGIGFILEYGIGFMKLSKLDKLNVATLLILGFAGAETLSIIGLGLLINGIVTFGICKSFKSPIQRTVSEDKIVISVRNRCDFTNISKIIKHDDRKIILDLSECLYVDMTANYELNILHEKIKDRLIIKGKPFNLKLTSHHNFEGLEVE